MELVSKSLTVKRAFDLVCNLFFDGEAERRLFVRRETGAIGRKNREGLQSFLGSFDAGVFGYSFSQLRIQDVFLLNFATKIRLPSFMRR